MEVYEAMLRRRMVRNFDGRPVPRHVVDRMLRHAVRAPSAGFTQGTTFLVLEESADRQRFWDVTSEAGWRDAGPRREIMSAPTIVVPFANEGAYRTRYDEPDKATSRITRRGWPAPYWTIDAAMATMLLLLGAVEEGLGAVFFALFDPEDRFHNAFGVPDAYEPIGAVAIGFAAPDRPSASTRRGRKPLGTVVHRGRWAT